MPKRSALHLLGLLTFANPVNPTLPACMHRPETAGGPPMQDKIAPHADAYATKKMPARIGIRRNSICSYALLPEPPKTVAKAVLDFLAKHYASTLE